MSYNSSDSTTGNAPLTANQAITIGPFQTGTSSKVGGSVFADQPGTLWVEQSFDGGQNYDISQAFTVVASTAQTIDIDVIAPIARIRYTNGATNQGALRVFLRAFGNRAAS